LRPGARRPSFPGPRYRAAPPLHHPGAGGKAPSCCAARGSAGVRTAALALRCSPWRSDALALRCSP